MAQQLNTDTSIVDYLKSTNQDSSYANRSKLAVDLGIVKSAGQYTGTYEQNVSLLQKVKNQKPPSAADVADKGSAADFINSDQTKDIAAVKQKDEPATRDSVAAPVGSTLVNAFKDLTGKSSVLPTTAAPAAPNFEQSYSELRQKYGVSDIEKNINDFQQEIDDLEAQKRISINAETDKTVALGVIEGRVGEQERNFNEKIDFYERRKARAVNELQAANDTIETMMNLKKMDYDVAKDAYDTEFSQNITLFNTIKGAVEFEISEEERAADNARSNLQIIYNSVQDGGLDINTIDTTTQAKINNLELKAGLPQGFYKNIAVEKPEAKVLSTTTRVVGGVKYADVVYKNLDGSLSTESVRIGASGSGGSGSTNSVNPTGEAAVSLQEYINAAQEELGQSLNPDSDLYRELEAQWKIDYPATSGIGFTSTEIKKLEQGGLLGASRQEQLDFLYGKDEEDSDNPFE